MKQRLKLSLWLYSISLWCVQSLSRGLQRVWRDWTWDSNESTSQVLGSACYAGGPTPCSQKQGDARQERTGDPQTGIRLKDGEGDDWSERWWRV
ncbi:hypothetical protein BDP81DRAFT_162860 [Colletotrichum phormii]|uniref:Secreted protein n=1 Tax=Colletotrichum phormii TaxID=359342 RepID=A0AAI9ZY70_9PEZI|nr:uncharacterized protein BDP81DRAFT_162860 [Colletotrichum phormii]KAK1640407.1 hypothetical protein BDP81DRAFT_162860 [Colletotrichum phormii]